MLRCFSWIEIVKYFDKLVIYLLPEKQSRDRYFIAFNPPRLATAGRAHQYVLGAFSLAF